MNTLDPSIAKVDDSGSRLPWTFEEDVRLYEGNQKVRRTLPAGVFRLYFLSLLTSACTLLETSNQHGNKWVFIKKLLFQNRSESDVKNRWTNTHFIRNIKEYKSQGTKAGAASYPYPSTALHPCMPTILTSYTRDGSQFERWPETKPQDKLTSCSTALSTSGSTSSSPLLHFAHIATTESEKSELRFKTVLGQ